MICLKDLFNQVEADFKTFFVFFNLTCLISAEHFARVGHHSGKRANGVHSVSDSPQRSRLCVQ